MDVHFEVMTQQQAEEIAYQWHYDGAYAFYDMEADQDDLEEFLDLEKRGNSMFVACENNEMIGFFCFHKVNEGTIDMALGMKPSLTGRGLGYEFMQAGIAFAQSTYVPEKIVLSVATFNQRAVKLYRKVGFKDVSLFIQETNGSRFEFLKMSYTPIYDRL